jgi:serine/threonine-protein kinase
MINQQLNNYKIISLLGEGGMALVYLAHDNKFDTEVAIKILKKEFVHNENIRKRFLAEAKNMFKMSHPNIIKVTDLIDAGDIVAFVMEYIEGRTLDEYINLNGVFKDAEIGRYFPKMIKAIEYVHDKGFIHRDIKPSNFILTKDHEIKLLDFGIAKNTNSDNDDYTSTNLGLQMGTPLYMSPEQIECVAPITNLTDIYSLGVTLWFMVMGHSPYNLKDISILTLQNKIHKEPLPLTRTIWDSTIQEATVKDPSKRSLNINAKKGVESISVSDTEIDPLIPQQKQKKEKRENKAFFNIKTISIGVGILLFVGILLISLSKGEKLDSTVATNPEDTTTETSLPTEKAEEPVSKKDKTRLPEDQETTNKNIPEEKKEEPKQLPIEKEQQKEDVKVAPIESSTKLKIGQKYQGGIIFYLDETGKHGKVCTENDMGKLDWKEAMARCRNLSLNGFNDWYLPYNTELNLLYTQRSAIGGFASYFYWSSTEDDNDNAWGQNFRNGNQLTNVKGFPEYVRAIRSF